MSLSFVESHDLYYVETGKWTTAVDVICTPGLDAFLRTLFLGTPSNSGAAGSALAVYNGFPQESTAYPILTGHTGPTGFHTRVPTGYSCLLWKTAQEVWRFPQLMTFDNQEDLLAHAPELAQKIGEHLLNSLMEKSLDSLGTAIMAAGVESGQWFWMVPAGALVKWAPNIIDFGQKMLGILKASSPPGGINKGGAIARKVNNWIAALPGEQIEYSVTHHDLSPNSARLNQLQEYRSIAEIWCQGMTEPMGSDNNFTQDQEDQFGGIMDAFNDVMRMMTLIAKGEEVAKNLGTVFGPGPGESNHEAWLSDPLLTSVKSQACRLTINWIDKQIMEETINITNRNEIMFDFEKFQASMDTVFQQYFMLPYHGGKLYNLADATGYTYFTNITEEDKFLQ